MSGRTLMILLKKAIVPVCALALATILVPDPVKLPLIQTTAKLLEAKHHESATVALAFGHMTRIDARPKWARSLAASDITSDGVRVFLNDGSRLVALSSSFGRKIWQSAEGFSGPFRLSGGKLFVVDQLGQRVVALDTKSGRRVWSSPSLATQSLTGLNRLLIGSTTVVLLSRGNLTFIDRRTGAVRIAASEGTGQQFDVATAQIVGSDLVAAQTISGGPMYRNIAAFELTSGRLDWESNWATAFWVKKGVVIYQVDEHFSGPFYSYTPLTLNFHLIDATGSGTASAPQTFSPDMPAHITRVFTSDVPVASIDWPQLVFTLNGNLYRYDLRMPADRQQPTRIEDVPEILGTFQNGSVLAFKGDTVSLISFSRQSARAAILPQVRMAAVAPDSVVELGREIVFSSSDRTYIVSDDGKFLFDITKDCSQVAAATMVGVSGIGVLCTDNRGVRFVRY